MGYSREAIKGIFWTFALRGGVITLATLRIPILAKVIGLGPRDFGAFAIATLALGFIEMLTETGINVFLIQEKSSIERYLSTAWVVSIIRGFIIALIIFFSAPFLAQFFHASDALYLLILISLVPLLRGFINPSVIRFQKELQFDREFYFKFPILFFETTLTITVAFITHSAISFAFGLIGAALLEVALSFLFLKPIPHLSFEKEKLKGVMHRGKWVTAAGIFNYLFHHTDDIVVGRMLGSFNLGLYQTGYRISIAPITEGADVVSKVTFPVYTKILGDKARLVRAVLRTTGGISFFVIPFGILLFSFPHLFISTLLGDQWLGAVPAIKLLAIFGIIRAISGSLSSLFLAVKKQEYVTFVTLISFLALVVSIVPLVDRFGIVGAAISVLTATILAVPFFAYFSWKILRAS